MEPLSDKDVSIMAEERLAPSELTRWVGYQRRIQRETSIGSDLNSGRPTPMLKRSLGKILGDDSDDYFALSSKVHSIRMR